MVERVVADEFCVLWHRAKPLAALNIIDVNFILVAHHSTMHDLFIVPNTVVHFWHMLHHIPNWTAAESDGNRSNQVVALAEMFSVWEENVFSWKMRIFYQGVSCKSTKHVLMPIAWYTNTCILTIFYITVFDSALSVSEHLTNYSRFILCRFLL